MPKYTVMIVFMTIHRRIQMLRYRAVIILLVSLITCQTSYAQNSIEADRIFAPAVGQSFYNLAYELGNRKDATRSDIQKAIILMQSTTLLDKQSDYVLVDMIKLAAKYPDQNYARLMVALLNKYVNESADLEVTQTGIQYLLNQLNSRQEREALLEKLLMTIGEKDKWLSSEISTSLGIYMLEKARFDAATFYFMQAYNSNMYNRLAFENLSKVASDQITSPMYMKYLNDALDQNPLDMNICLEFAKYAYQMQIYEIATQAYNYCSDLFSYLHPSQPLPPWIYLPWSLSAYNTPTDQYKCLKIAKKVRESGTFDLMLETIAGKAAIKMKDIPQAEQILMTAETKALQLLAENKVSQFTATQQLAWFYTFAAVNPAKAINNANKAYSLDPNSPQAASLLAYSLVMNNQTDLAKPILEQFKDNPIADIAIANIQLNEGKKSEAITTLKSMINKDPGTIESELAKKILKKNDSEYVPSVSSDVIAKEFVNNSAQTAMSPFKKPEDCFSLSLNVKGGKFSYNTKIDCTVTIENHSSKPLVISEYGLLKGNIRIDAKITGDIEKQLPELVSMKFKPSSPIKAGQSILVPIRIVTGELKQILETYPQASLDIELTAYLDPVIADDGKVANMIAGIKPTTITVSRPGINLDTRYLQNRLDALSKGHQGQKILITQLFAGLLREQKAMANKQPLYQFMYADWMWPLLKSAMQKSISDDDWTVKVHTMIEMLSLPLDYQLTQSVSENLADSHWPARLIAIYLLSKKQSDDFNKVLDYYAEYDTNKFVREMAISLGGKKTEITAPAEPNDVK